MEELIKVLKAAGQLVVESRQVAKDFEKDNSKINRSIENIQKNDLSQNWTQYFMPSKYKDDSGKLNKQYLLTRDGFSLLIMGFTGAKALEWKLKYIKAFNDMEQALKNKQPKLSKELQAIFTLDTKAQKIETRMDNLENEMPLFNIECKEIQSLVRKTGIRALGGYKSPAYNNNSLRGKVYSDIQRQLKREFGVEKYEAIKRVQINTAKEIILEYRTPIVLVNQINVVNSQISM